MTGKRACRLIAGVSLLFAVTLFVLLALTQFNGWPFGVLLLLGAGLFFLAIDAFVASFRPRALQKLGDDVILTLFELLG